MGKIKVGSGFGKVTFQVALTRAKPGDLVVLDPGRYVVDQVQLLDLRLQGNGDANDVEIIGSIEVLGHCALTNLTLRAMPYKNAIYIESPSNMATVTDCILQGEPGAKYPTVWCDQGTIVLNRVIGLSDPEQYDIAVVASSTLHSTASQLGRVLINASKADLIESTTRFLEVTNGARVSAYGSHKLESVPGNWVFYVSGQSVCNFPQIVLGDDKEQGFARDSIIQIEAVSQEEGGSFAVMTEGGARIHTSSLAVVVVDKDAKPTEPPIPTGPKTIQWNSQDAQDFKGKIAPQVAAGDTIVLEEGDYTLEEYECLYLGANLMGQGHEHTRLHGTVGGIASGQSTIRNLTICAPAPERHAIRADQNGARLRLENVALQPFSGSQTAVLYASAGHVNLDGCGVTVTTDEAELQDGISVVAAAKFDARNSGLSWFYVARGAEATLHDCVSYVLHADTGASINVIDTHHILANTTDTYELIASNGGALEIQALTTSVDQLCARLDGGRLTLANFGSDDSEVFNVYKVHGEVRGIEQGAFNLFEADENGEFVLVREATRGLTAQQRVDDPPQQLHSNSAEAQLNPTSNDGVEDALDDTTPDPLAELHSLVGLGKVKQQVQGFVNVVKLRQKRIELGLSAEDDFTLHSIFLGNPGTGKTRVARLVGRVMFQAGIVSKDIFVEAGRADLVSENIGGTAKKTRALLESGRGGVIFLDEAYALASEDSAGFAEEAVTEILTFMENHRSDTMVILAGYNDKMHELLAVNEGLKSRIKHRFDFSDYSSAEIADIGLGELIRGQYSVNEAVYRRVVSDAYAKSADRSNARWVRNFNQDLRTQQGERVILIDDPSRDDLTTIIDEDLHAIAGGDPLALKTKLTQSLAELDALTGLAPVKEWVRSLVEQATVNQLLVELDGAMERPNYHVAFTGNPGTGKTTVAKIISEIFYSLGILGTPTVETFAATQLIGKYLGHSAANTHRAFDAAMGGVLLIDEAHQLRGAENNDVMRQEVVDAMITRLEDDRDKFIAVFAGYTDQMHEFFEADPGLKSRIPAEIEFPDYTAAEVAEIATALLSRNWKFNSALFAEVTAAAYDSLPTSGRDNGRWARTFTETVIARHNRYLVTNDIRGEALKCIPDEVLRECAP